MENYELQMQNVKLAREFEPTILIEADNFNRGYKMKILNRFNCFN